MRHSYSVGLGPDLELQVVDVLQVAAGTREEEGGGGDVGLWEEQSLGFGGRRRLRRLDLGISA
jgi:hypothetical protein